MAPSYVWGSTVSRLQSQYEETVYFLPLSPREVSVLIWSTLEGWKAESTLEPTSALGHCQDGSLINLMLITMFDTYSTQRSLGAS